MADQEHVYVVMTTSWQHGPLWGVFAEAWDAIDAVRRGYPGTMMVREVPSDQHVDGTVFLATIMGEANTTVWVRKVPVQGAAGEARPTQG